MQQDCSQQDRPRPRYGYYESYGVGQVAEPRKVSDTKQPHTNAGRHYAHCQEALKCSLPHSSRRVSLESLNEVRRLICSKRVNNSLIAVAKPPDLQLL